MKLCAWGERGATGFYDWPVYWSWRTAWPVRDSTHKTGVSISAQPKGLETDIRTVGKGKKENWARKRIETLFSQLTDQFLVIRNYAKITNGLFARIIGKISTLTILQYVNFINNRPIGRIKYALS